MWVRGMGTKVQCDSYYSGYVSMKDFSDDSNSCSWPIFCGDKTFTNGQYHNGFSPMTIADAYLGYDKNALKQTMLEHEAVFKNQLCELHRLYRIQRDLMDEIKRKELHKNQIPVGTSLLSSPLASQVASEEARKWLIPNFPLANSVCARPTSGVEDIHSPLSSLKGSSSQVSPLPSQNGVTSKDVEMLESRPTKVRRKMFDLQLPADEYIDTEEEQFRDGNLSGSSSHLSNRNCEIAPKCRTKLFLDNGGKNKCQEVAFRSESLRRKNNVADLNEPIEVEETNTSAYADHICCTSSHQEIQGHELAAKTNSELLGFSKEISRGSLHGRDNEIFNNPQLDDNQKEKWWFLGEAHMKNHVMSVSHQPVKLPTSSQLQVLVNGARDPRTVFLSDQSKVDQLRERPVCGLELSERNCEMSNNIQSASVVASQTHTPCSTVPFANLDESWSHSVLSWEKPSDSLHQKSISVQMNPFLTSSAPLSQGSQLSTQSHGILRDRWNYNSNIATNPTFGREMPNRDGFFHGSSSRSKELDVHLPLGNHDYLKCTVANNVASDSPINHGSVKFCKSSNSMDFKSANDVNLNALFSNSSSNKDPLQQVNIIDLERKHEDHLLAFPWLRAKPSCNEGTNAGMDLNVEELSFSQSSQNHLSNVNESRKGPVNIGFQNTKSASCSNAVDASSIEITDHSSCRKILGFPIVEKSHTSKNISSPFTTPVSHPRQSDEEEENQRKNRVLDINLPCDLAVPEVGQQMAGEVLVEREMDENVANFRHEIDLNYSMNEDEASLMPAAPVFNAKIITGIDLEVPAVLETDEDFLPGEECLGNVCEAPLRLPLHKAESPQDDVSRIAAEAIVAISSSAQHSHLDDSTCNPSEACETEPLHWFAEIISTYENLGSSFDVVSRVKDGEENESSSEVIDYFESMTLRLKETREEDYMPKPLAPENLKLEETGAALLPTRTRKGQARRGRQRRDFQRDILPGLASLSRHEVTEDLQTFGGLMRATGHLWHSGLMRRNSTRNGCGRGRRRSLISPSPPVMESPPCNLLLQQLNNIEVALEDRSLTGWGKTTRRPRRQRCPAGNPQSFLVT